MRLFHFSEEADIAEFEPIDGSVWAINEEMAVNYLLPRDCPRVTFGIGHATSAEDASGFQAMARGFRRVIVIENAWVGSVLSTKLTRYEFDEAGFALHHKLAGNWSSPHRQIPISSTFIENLEEAIRAEGGLLIAAASIWPFVDQVTDSTLRYSVIRQMNAQPRQG